MGRKRRSPSSFKIFSLLLILAVAGYRVWQGEWPLDGLKTPETPKASTKVFQVIPNATLLDDRDNDGDSFKLKHGNEVHVFRLYFADCPEKRRHSYNAERLAEQGHYFGGLSEAQTVALGLNAKARTEDWLRNRRFTIYTKWQQVYDSGRYYAFVVFEDGQDLSEKLVREGLARIHTTGTTLPDGRSRADFEKILRQREREAQSVRRGGWGMQ